VPDELVLQLASRHIPDSNCTITRSRRDTPSIGGESDGPDPIGVPLKFPLDLSRFYVGDSDLVVEET
jgi:hypothetical protein